jgi:uncharacterized protein
LVDGEAGSRAVVAERTVDPQSADDGPYTVGPSSCHDASMVHLSVEPLSQEECMALLPSATIGRIGTTVDALPVVLPVRFALHNGSLMFRTMPGTKLHHATLNAVVALQADHYDDNDPFGWSVLVQGVAQEIVDPHRLAAARLLPLGPWAPDGRYNALEPAIVSGRRIVLTLPD